jgi:hypothetical protein
LGKGYRSFSFSLRSFLHSPVTSFLFRPKYSSQHPQPTFLLQCQRPIIVTIIIINAPFITTVRTEVAQSVWFYHGLTIWVSDPDRSKSFYVLQLVPGG